MVIWKDILPQSKRETIKPVLLVKQHHFLCIAMQNVAYEYGMKNIKFTVLVQLLAFMMDSYGTKPTRMLHYLLQKNFRIANLVATVFANPKARVQHT